MSHEVREFHAHLDHYQTFLNVPDPAVRDKVAVLLAAYRTAGLDPRTAFIRVLSEHRAVFAGYDEPWLKDHA